MARFFVDLLGARRRRRDHRCRVVDGDLAEPTRAEDARAL